MRRTLTLLVVGCMTPLLASCASRSSVAAVRNQVSILREAARRDSLAIAGGQDAMQRIAEMISRVDSRVVSLEAALRDLSASKPVSSEQLATINQSLSSLQNGLACFASYVAPLVDQRNSAEAAAMRADSLITGMLRLIFEDDSSLGVAELERRAQNLRAAADAWRLGNRRDTVTVPVCDE